MTQLQPQYKANGFVLTGGPGAGKTTVLDLLVQQGFKAVPEVARQIIREQMAAGGEALPWKNTMLYKQVMAERTIAAWNTVPNDDGHTYIFDRGLPDVIAYERILRAPPDDALHQAALTYRYHPAVLLFPPWEKIYTTDEERKQTFAEALETYQIIMEVYTAYGYNCVEVPPATPAERAAFIRAVVMQ